MARMRLEAFEEQVTAACAASSVVNSLSLVASGVTWAQLRAHLTYGSFIDMFYNEATGRISFALIKENQRIFGADNTGGWHWHLFEVPDHHSPSVVSVTFEEFLHRIEEHYAKSK